MKLLIFRHGQADHNVTRTFDSSLNSKAHLTSLGVENLLVNIRAAKDVCEKNNIGFTAIYSSPLLRTVETSLLIHQELKMSDNIQIILDLRLRELMMGKWDKKSSVDYPGKNWDFSRNSEWGGESEDDVRYRIKHFLDTLRWGENYIIVSHGDPIRKIVQYIIPENYIPLQGSGILIDIRTKEKILFNKPYRWQE